MGLTAGIIGGLGLLSAGVSAWGANSAADTQANAANNANNMQLSMYNQTAQRLAPYTAMGDVSAMGLMANMPGFVSPIKMNQKTLEQTPGYQFNLDQGLKAVQSGAAARGLGLSGAALKGAADYSSGLAANTYQQQFQNAAWNKQFAYNALSQPISIGENAAAQTGNAGMNAATNMGNNLMGAANAQGAATIAGANAFSGLGNNLMQYYMQNNLASKYSGGLY